MPDAPAWLLPRASGLMVLVVPSQVAPSKIGAPTSGVFIQYRSMHMSCKWLRHTNARYGGADQQPPTPLSRGRAQACGAAERPSRPRQHMYRRFVGRL
eukprot:828649-Pleurochrysis_carterae.AAC.1